MARSRISARRRQRSVRVTVAVVLLAVATLAVLITLPTQSPVLLSISAVAAILLGWAALRIVWTEVLQSRRENSTDRAAAARAYQSLFSERAAEHAEFTTAMTERLAESAMSVRELQGLLVKTQAELAGAIGRSDASESAHAAALVRVAELERSIELLKAEQKPDSETPAPGSVEELLAFDEKVAAAAKQSRTASPAAESA